ncbi:peptidoglycan DD-metalloendopeptidase family protein [Massilia forsythiae]|uniref:Peptidoglycan DD-metalloendopeptidase family protein n=1 Tax=Massilia forsythiae TaxID=2728020 RepID=A0A7Z2W145_9BURK|nr:peptidoglycan DD-metalloendopeptidase family protein [Massilia forsythiae]QJE03233.1 peptidoglycan DD-metalloendopeptidase family protein [Massilia forsythiae]
MRAAAPRITERSKQKAAAEAERAGIQQKLGALKKDITRTESAKEDAADELAESEESISNANRALRELADEQSATNDKLKELNNEQARLEGTIAAQKRQLAKLLREHYVSGNEDRIKLLLSGDNPNRINRDLQMMSYVSQAQATLLDGLRGNLAAVEANHAKTQNAKDELEEIAGEQRDQKTLLEQEKAKRASLLANLSSKLVTQRKEASSLERDEQRMSGLVDRLTQLIREQEAAAAAERKRQEALAAARAKAEAEAKARALARAKAEQAERERLAALAREAAKAAAREAARTGKPVKPAPVPAPAPVREEPQVAQVEPRPQPPARSPDTALASEAPSGAFESQRGRMPAPIGGKIAARFGAKRGDGPTWRGMFIKAPEGTDVRAIAAGRVVFANWMRGYGNLIIVNHGGEYLSIYGNNQTLVKRVGDAVKPGEVVASAGNTGGNEESGLYFELRHLGKAFDPAGWVRF